MLDGSGRIPPGGNQPGSASLGGSGGRKQSILQVLHRAEREIYADVQQLTAGRDETALERVGPTVIGSYRNLGLIGRGNMKSVFLANDVEHGYVTLHVPHAEIIINPAHVARFSQEVRTLYYISEENPNVMGIHYAKLKGDEIYYVAEYIRGVDLDKLIQEKGKLPLDQALAIFYWAFQGLSKVHEKGAIHRDLKPENIMLNHNGVVKIVDFGLGKPKDVTIELTSDGDIFGTIIFLPPEILTRGARQLKPDADIYAMGLILGIMLLGNIPPERQFTSDTHGYRQYCQYVTGPEPFFSDAILNSLQLPPKLKPAVIDLIQKMTKKNPAERLNDHNIIKRRILGILQYL